MHEDEAPVRLKTKFHKHCSPAPWLRVQSIILAQLYTHMGCSEGQKVLDIPLLRDAAGSEQKANHSQSQGQAMYFLCVTPFVDRILAALYPFHI